MEQMQDWLFHYNPYTEIWTAFKRENSNKYFNGELKEHEMHKSKKIEVLFSFLTRELKSNKKL